MKREAIERLAIDSAAGELNEDILALFDAYLAEHPQAGQWAEDITGIIKRRRRRLMRRHSVPMQVMTCQPLRRYR